MLSRPFLLDLVLSCLISFFLGVSCSFSIRLDLSCFVPGFSVCFDSLCSPILFSFVLFFIFPSYSCLLFIVPLRVDSLFLVLCCYIYFVLSRSCSSFLVLSQKLSLRLPFVFNVCRSSLFVLFLRDASRSPLVGLVRSSYI